MKCNQKQKSSAAKSTFHCGNFLSVIPSDCMKMFWMMIIQCHVRLFMDPCVASSTKSSFYQNPWHQNILDSELWETWCAKAISKFQWNPAERKHVAKNSSSTFLEKWISNDFHEINMSSSLHICLIMSWKNTVLGFTFTPQTVISVWLECIWLEACWDMVW